VYSSEDSAYLGDLIAAQLGIQRGHISRSSFNGGEKVCASAACEQAANAPEERAPNRIALGESRTWPSEAGDSAEPRRIEFAAKLLGPEAGAIQKGWSSCTGACCKLRPIPLDVPLGPSALDLPLGPSPLGLPVAQYYRILMDERHELVGQDVIYICSTTTDDNLLELVRLGCAFAAYGARRRIFIIPFMGYRCAGHQVPSSNSLFGYKFHFHVRQLPWRQG